MYHIFESVYNQKKKTRTKIALKRAGCIKQSLIFLLFYVFEMKKKTMHN